MRRAGTFANLAVADHTPWLPRDNEFMDEQIDQTRLGTPGLLTGRDADSNTRAALACLSLLAVSLLLRLIYLGSPADFDEMYTVLAAHGWSIHGEPRIGEGVYDRAVLFTILVAWFFDWFGESIVVARLPSAIAGSLLVVAVFWWTRAVAGSLAAWIAALFVALAPIEIQVSQFARFYALQGLVFWLGAIGIYAACTREFDHRTTIPLLIACGIVLLFAVHLQILTVIGLAGLLLWVALAIGLRVLLSLRSRPALFWGIIATVIILGAAILSTAFLSGVLGGLLERYRHTPLHALPVRNQVWFYHLALIERYPSLWPFFPIAALLAIATRPRAALFCLSVFVPGFILLSFGGMKQFKYLAFLLPFLSVVWAIALAEVFTVLREAIVSVTDRALEAVAPDLPRRSTRYLLIAGCIAFLILANGATARTLLLPFGIQLNPEGAPVDWEAARETLQPWVDDASLVLTNDELAVLYHLGRFDVTVSGSRLSELDDQQEFSIDDRTGRPVVSTAESIAHIMACYPNGLVLTDTRKWRNPAQLDNEVADLIERHAEPIDMPRGSRIVAFRWGAPDLDVPPDACAVLPELRAGR
jgi:4-amino-4-deoxy-L-arabinose transferase-like glycosyltransferase